MLMRKKLLYLYSQRKSQSLLKQLYSQELNRFEKDFEKFHCNTNNFQKAALSVGSAAVSILNPYRGDMIACLGETTGEHALRYMHEKLLKSPEGSEILKNQPRINSDTIDLEYLKSLPQNTLGNLYQNFLETNKVSPDDRVTIQFIDDVKLGYVMQRYREVHDLIHAVLQMPTNMLGEVTVKWVEALQFKLPMCIMGAIFGPVRLKTKHRSLYLNHYLPWALKTGVSAEFLLNIYFEQRWEQNLDDFYREVKITPLKLDK